MRDRIEALAIGGACGPKTAEISATNRSFFSLLNRQSNVVIRQEIGRPPYLIHDLTDDLYYRSQSRAAQALGVSNKTVSEHVTGKRPHVLRHILKRVEVAK